MKKVTIIAAASFAVAAPFANAQDSDTETYTVSAVVVKECSVEQPQNVDFSTLDIETDPGTGALLLTGDRARNIQDIWVSCNYPASMKLTGTPMKADQGLNGANPAEFTDTIHYILGIEDQAGNTNGEFQKIFFDTRAQPNGQSKMNTKAFHELAKLQTTFRKDLAGDGTSDQRPIAANYEGTVTLELGTL